MNSITSTSLGIDKLIQLKLGRQITDGGEEEKQFKLNLKLNNNFNKN